MAATGRWDGGTPVRRTFRTAAAAPRAASRHTQGVGRRAAPERPMSDAYERLIALLDAHGAQYRVLEHPPEGRTEVVSPMRGNALAQAAKCMVLMLKRGKKVTEYVLAVVPGDTRVDLAAVKALKQATYISF